MSIIEDFDNLDKVSYSLWSVYCEISDYYRGPDIPTEFEKGMYSFIETAEGKKLEKELSALTDRNILSIDEITGKLNENIIIQKEDTDKINIFINSFTLNYTSIHAKIVWFNERNMDLNERAKLNGYYEKFDSKVRSLHKVLTEKRDILNIITIWEAIEEIKKTALQGI